MQKHRAQPSTLFFFIFQEPKIKYSSYPARTASIFDSFLLPVVYRDARAGRPFVREFIRTCTSWETRRQQLLARFFLFFYCPDGIPEENTATE